jgi:tetratricopeptide (TPR) repeat protein
MHAYDTKDRRRPFGLNRATLRVLERAGYIRMVSGQESEYTFEELILLRTVGALRLARVPTRTINRALRQLRPWLDEASPVSRLSLDATADVIRVRDGQSLWEPASGQYALPLETTKFEAKVVSIVSHEKSMKNKRNSAHSHYLRGIALEDDDAKGARAAYESCLAGDCRHLEARINLGRLLHLEGLLREAEDIYNGYEEPSAVLYFNLGVLLEDLKRELDAVEAYRQAIVHDPGMADAHFNLSLLHERLGDARASFRHLLTYRRLMHAHQTND